MEMTQLFQQAGNGRYAIDRQQPEQPDLGRRLAQAQQMLQLRTRELRELISRTRQFNSNTTVEEVMETQARTTALRTLIQAIEREIRLLS